MHWDWDVSSHMVDNVAIIMGIVVLIVRQFIWRSTQLRKMFKLPVVIIVAGLVYVVVELRGGFQWISADWIIVGELFLVAVTGTIMGYATRFRMWDEHLQYKLSRVGVLLWALFILVRVGSFYLASSLGANLAGATGLILLSFGVNRLATMMVVRRRTEAILAFALHSVEKNSA